MPNPKISLEPDRTYHVFNHAVGHENFFQNDDNYIFFLKKIKKWVLPVADIFAYCLMPNHFHIVVRIKNLELLNELWIEKLRKRNRVNKFGEADSSKMQLLILNDLITEQFSHCFNSYAQSYNKMYDRKGSLFKQSFQRKWIDTNDYLYRVICYIHNNPVIHGFVKKKEEWKYSSYSAINGNKPTLVLKEEVLELFGGIENFIYLHNKYFGDEI